MTVIKKAMAGKGTIHVFDPRQIGSAISSSSNGLWINWVSYSVTIEEATIMLSKKLFL